MHAPTAALRHVVVIATVPGRESLLERALRCVADQTVHADRVVVVPDGDETFADRVGAAARTTTMCADVVPNRRTRGLAGACNTAIDHILRSEVDPARVFVSFLDDDDTWEPEYLAYVARAALGGATVVAGTIIRHDGDSPEGRAVAAPVHVTPDDFLVGNPGLQGSNLSVRLDHLLLAGMFDEALSSCTDRDLAIRLLDVGARYAHAPQARAHHDTLHGRGRLSDPGQPKRRALDTFYAKYRCRMTPQQGAMFADRARRLFGWHPPALETTPQGAPAACPPPLNPEAGLTVVVGVVINGDVPGRSLPLLDGLARLKQNPGIDRLELVLLENGDEAGFRAVAERARELQLRSWPVTLAAQLSVAPEAGLAPGDVSRGKAIAVSRTLLHRFVHNVATAEGCAVAWIVDDDVRVPLDTDRWVSDVSRLRHARFDVVIGSISGSPPVPAASIVRTQLVDVLALLQAARTKDADEPVEAIRSSNARWTDGRRDYYYDLARHDTDRLETPFMPPLAATTVGAAVQELLGHLDRILAGEAVTRPVAPAGGDVVSDAAPSCLRGGNTLVFDVELLRVPNLAPRLQGRPVRRSDMLWAANAALRLGRRVVSAPFDVWQDRTADVAERDPAIRLVDDILGYAFFRAYEQVLDARGVSNAPLASGEREQVLHQARKYARERFAAYRLSFWRSRGLAVALRQCAQGSWLSCLAGPTASEQLQSFLVLLDARFDPNVFEHQERTFSAAQEAVQFSAYLDEVDVHLAARQPVTASALAEWTETSRAARAIELIRRHRAVDIDEVLGAGSEGVVLRTGGTVLKVFDRLSASARAGREAKLRSIASGPRVTSLPRITSILDMSGTLVLETEWEPSDAYRGGHGPQLVEALRELITAGWVHTNITPANLRVAARGVSIIDIGRSLEPTTAVGVERMVRRAFLAWRFSFRSDLPELMRRSVDTDDFPELVGWRGLLEAVRGPSPKAELDAAVAGEIRSAEPRTVLDFGCGKPRRRSLVGSRPGWVGFDPDPELTARWARSDHATAFWDLQQLRRALERGARFDAIACSLVLCTLADAEALAVLRDIRRLVDDRGTVIIAVCDPTSVAICQTTYQTRPLQSRYYEERWGYVKHVGGAAAPRAEHHRSIDGYRRLFAAAGLVVDRERTIDGIDLERFESVSEFVIFRLRRLSDLPQRTSLLVKTCALEAETAEHQIKHLVLQLGAPRAFDEVVVVCDPYRGAFPRSHCAGNLDVLRAALRRLVDDGWVSRVVEGPTDGDIAADIAWRWFGARATSSHAANGQPLLAVAAGFEACTGDLILHADADVMVARPDPRHDHIADAARTFEAIPSAVTLALSVFGDTAPRPRFEDERGAYRVEAQVGWLHRQRLVDLLPLPNRAVHGVLELPWHRALDLAVREGRATSIRRGSEALWYASPDNARKGNIDDLFLLMDRVEGGLAPRVQRHRANMQGTHSAWLGPKRQEELIVVICGRNTGPGRVRRCLASLAAQTFRDWGAIIVDDASTNGTWDVLKRHAGRLPNVTMVRRRQRVGTLANTVLAVRHLIARPAAIVVLLDLDDALGRRDALALVLAEHRDGAEVTVGSMVRTDKSVVYEVDFSAPRTRRGGNVWQHLRSFRKALFDRIDPAHLQTDGEWIGVASDWAFMVPIVEMAGVRRWIREAIYLHEPGAPRDTERVKARESVIARVVSGPRYPLRSDGLGSLTVVVYHRILPPGVTDPVTSVYRSRGMVVSVESLRTQLRSMALRFSLVSLRDVARAARGEMALPRDPLLVTFDDGYSDFEHHALPQLEDLGIPPVLFARVPTTDGRPPWAPLDLAYHALGTAGYGAVCPASRDQLLRLSPEDQLAWARACAAHLDEEQQGVLRSELYLSASTLRVLADRGVELGAHGVEHLPWPALSDAVLGETLVACRKWLRSMGQPVATVAYPDGAATEAIAHEVARHGFDLGFALTTDAPTVCSFRIRRLVAVDDPAWADVLGANREAAE